MRTQLNLDLLALVGPAARAKAETSQPVKPVKQVAKQLKNSKAAAAGKAAIPGLAAKSKGKVSVSC